MAVDLGKGDGVLVWDYSALGDLQILVEGYTCEITDAIVEDMRRGCPVDTGELLESIDHICEGLTSLITVGTDHWEFVEYGTSKMDAQPFIRPAVYRER